MIKPKVSLALLTLIPLCGCVNSLAAIKTNPNYAPEAELQQEAVEVDWFKAGYYVGAKLGKSELDSDAADLDADLAARGFTTSTSLDNGDTAVSVYGGYRFAAPFALEVGYINLGRVESNIAATPANLAVFLGTVADEHPFLGQGINVKGLYHVIDQQRFQLGLSLGLWYWDVDVDAEAANGSSVNINESGLDFNFGLQGQVGVGQGLSVVLAVERFMLDGNDADSIWIGLQGAL